MSSDGGRGTVPKKGNAEAPCGTPTFPGGEKPRNYGAPGTASSSGLAGNVEEHSWLHRGQLCFFLLHRKAPSCSALIFGDVNHDECVDHRDILCVLDAFGGAYNNCAFDHANINPCITLRP